MNLLIENSEVKIRKLAFECLQKVFESVDDDLEVILKNFFKNQRDFLLNEIKAIYKRAEKNRRGKVKLFEPEGGYARGNQQHPGDKGAISEPAAGSSNRS